jgi:hypothetical protein
MATKVLKRIVTEYLKRFAEPRIKELTGLEVELSIWGVSTRNELSGTQGKIFIDVDPIIHRNSREGKMIEKIVLSYGEDALKFLNTEKNYRILINQRSLDQLDEQEVENVEHTPNSEYKMLEKLLSHKKYEDNGITFEFFNIRHNKNSISIETNSEISKDRGWNHHMIEFFAYNIINEKIKYIDSSGMLDVKLDRIYVNGEPIKNDEYYLPTKLENKLESIFNKIPDFGISYNDFDVIFKVKYDGLYDLYNDDYQVVINCGINIENIILKKPNSNKKVVISSVPQDLMESLYTLFMEDTDTELEELRYIMESEVYQEVISEAFSMYDTEENYMSFYLIPEKICGKKVSSYSGGSMDNNEIEEYFRKLVSKSID